MADESTDQRVTALEIKVELIERQLANYEQAFNLMGQFVVDVGDAAIKAHKTEEAAK